MRPKTTRLCAGGAFVFALILACGSLSPAAAAPVQGCAGSRDGRIDFAGRLGTAGGASFVQIFPWSDGAVAYADDLEHQLGVAGASAAHPMTLADLEAATAAARQIPAAMASASQAALVKGEFSCTGFAPGRYLLLAQVQGGSGQPGEVKALIEYFRADVDASSIRRHVVVLVNGFRRIASYPRSL